MKITTLRRTCSLFALLASLSLLGLSSAQAETVRCTAVGALPATITVPGIYCLFNERSVNVAGGNAAAITIFANNVVLDLNDHTLTNLSTATDQVGRGTGILGRRQNLTIRNGTLKGFTTGIDAGGNANVIEDFFIDQIFSPEFGSVEHGIIARGTNIIVRNNRVIGPVTAGITLRGDNLEANDNVVSQADTAIEFSDGLIRSNNVFAVNNHITASGTGINLSGAFSGKYRDNLTSGVIMPYNPGDSVVDAGNNN